MTRLPVLGALLVGGLLAATAFAPARAADYEGPYGRPYPPPPPMDWPHRPPPPPPPRFDPGPPPPPCRIVVRRHIDPDGDEVIRRTRICDRPPGYGPPRLPPDVPRWERRYW